MSATLPSTQSVTTCVLFSAAHVYRRDDWDDAKNESVFGLCANPQGHGHNYRVEVTVSGALDRSTGMVVNFDALFPVLTHAIQDKLDHRHLNNEIHFFNTRIPTLENIALYCWQELLDPIASLNVTLRRIRVYEREDLFVDYEGVKP